MLENSVLGLADVYSLLPPFVVIAPNVKIFQRRLQDMLRIEAQTVDNAWPRLSSLRNTLCNHKFIERGMHRGGDKNAHNG